MIDWRSAMADAELRRRQQLEDVRWNSALVREFEVGERKERNEAENPPVLGVLVAALVSLLAAGIISPR